MDWIFLQLKQKWILGTWNHHVYKHDRYFFINLIFAYSKQTFKSQAHSLIIYLFCKVHKSQFFYWVALLSQRLINPFIKGMQHLIPPLYSWILMLNFECIHWKVIPVWTMLLKMSRHQYDLKQSDTAVYTAMYLELYSFFDIKSAYLLAWQLNMNDRKDQYSTHTKLKIHT